MLQSKKNYGIPIGANVKKLQNDNGIKIRFLGDINNKGLAGLTVRTSVYLFFILSGLTHGGALPFIKISIVFSFI